MIEIRQNHVVIYEALLRIHPDDPLPSQLQPIKTSEMETEAKLPPAG